MSDKENGLGPEDRNQPDATPNGESAEKAEPDITTPPNIPPTTPNPKDTDPPTTPPKTKPTPDAAAPEAEGADAEAAEDEAAEDESSADDEGSEDAEGPLDAGGAEPGEARPGREAEDAATAAEDPEPADAEGQDATEPPTTAAADAGSADADVTGEARPDTDTRDTEPAAEDTDLAADPTSEDGGDGSTDDATPADTSALSDHDESAVSASTEDAGEQPTEGDAAEPDSPTDTVVDETLPSVGDDAADNAETASDAGNASTETAVDGVPPSAEDTDKDTATDNTKSDKTTAEGDEAPATDEANGEETATATGDEAAATGDGGAAGDGEKVAAAGGAGGGKGKRPRKRRSRRAKWVRRGLYALGALILLPIVAIAVIYLMTPIPSSAQPAAKAQKSVFYYSDGKTVIARSGVFDRRPVDLKDVPKPVQQAVISAENRSFYTDPGVSVKGSARAVWATLTGGSTQGGSTITQQMVRNYYSGLSQDRTVTRKLKEIMIALKVGREKDKNWILQQYLNTIYFGRDAYGIEAAAQAYYNKDVGQLTTAEGAYLAAAIQVPSLASEPTRATTKTYVQSRWQYVMNGLVQAKAITPQDAAAAKFPLPPKQKQKSVFAGEKGYMVARAKVELRQMGYTDNQINMGGLKVRTTFDKNLMDAAKSAVESNVPSGTPKGVQTGLASIDPSTGEVRAIYGGKEYLDNQFDNAFDASVQVGSGYKPYVLAAALADGKSLNDTVDGSTPQTFAGTQIKNDSGENFGYINLTTATEHSVNTAYVNLGQEIGDDKIAALSAKIHIQVPKSAMVPVLPLGVVDASPAQQAAGYATFAAEGTYHRPHVVKAVTQRDGKEKKVTVAGERAFSTQVARDATYAMQKVIDGGTGTAAALPDRNAAGKTGTTSSGAQLWFNGFIPQLATSVAMFNQSRTKALHIPGYSSYGGDLPARIWRSYMTVADRNIPVKSFGSPSTYSGSDGPSRTTPPTYNPRPTHSAPPTHTRPPTEGPPTGGPPTGGPPTGGPPTHGPPTHKPPHGNNAEKARRPDSG